MARLAPLLTLRPAIALVHIEIDKVTTDDVRELSNEELTGGLHLIAILGHTRTPGDVKVAVVAAAKTLAK